MTVKQESPRLFHVLRYGETTWGPAESEKTVDLSDRDIGFLVGILCGEGHFGGDGKQPQVTLRMHTRHESLFRWLEGRLPGSRLYGPYHHGGRSYFQWMARGPFLRQELAPLLAAHADLFDDYARARFTEMCRKYHIEAGPPPIDGGEATRPH